MEKGQEGANKHRSESMVSIMWPVNNKGIIDQEVIECVRLNISVALAWLGDFQ